LDSNSPQHSAQIYQFPDSPEQLNDRAFSLLMNQWEAESDEQRHLASSEIDHFRSQSTVHARALKLAEEDWAAMGHISPPPVLLKATTHISWGSRLRQHQKSLSAVAALLLFAVTLPLLYPLLNQPEQKTLMVSRERFSSGNGQTLTHTLADGSRIVLNWNTDLRIEFTPAARHVFLKRGEAIFTVAKDPQRPFIVHSGDVDTRAVGTEFSVHRLSQNESNIAVTEGVVAVSDAAQPRRANLNENHQQLLHASEEVTMNNGEFSTVTHVSNEEVTAWTRGMLVFRDAPLSEVLSELERYSNYRIIADYLPDAETEVTATYFIGQTDQALQSIISLFNLQADFQPGSYFTRVELRPARPQH